MQHRPPAFQLYIDDWRGSRSVQRMTFGQRGMYMEMLIEQWDKGCLPDCPRACAHLLGGTEEEWLEHWPTLRRKFVVRRKKTGTQFDADIPTDHDASRQIINLRLERYKRSLRSFKRGKAEAGKKGGHGKAQKLRLLEAGKTLAKPSTDVAKPSSVSVSSTVTPTLFVPVGAPAATDARSRRPIYTSDRFSVFEWQLNELSQMLGPHYEGFDLHGFFDALSQKSRADGLVIARGDVWPWLQARVLAEAKRRNLPMASAAPTAQDKAAEHRAQAERVLAEIQEARRAGR